MDVRASTALRALPWVLSAGAHLAAIVVLPPRSSPPPVRRSRVEETDRVSLSFTVEGPANDAVVVRSEDAADVAAPRAVRSASSGRRAPAIAPELAASVVEPVPIERIEVPRSREEPGRQRPALEPAIDPEHVARSWLQLDPLTPEAAAARAERAIERRLDAELRARAMTKAHVTERRIELVPRRDGSYVYRGDGFVAVIAPDGSVRFDDRADVALGARGPLQTDGSGVAVQPRGEPALPDALAELATAVAPFVDPLVAMQIDPNVVRAPDGTEALPELLTAPGGMIETMEPPALTFGIGGTFDLHGALSRAGGQDPHAAERQRFLEETETLRDRLTDARAARERAAALRRLRARLRRIWADASRSAEARRRVIFELWDDLSEDDVGRVAREAIERFVREQLPEGSPDAYPRAELERLGAQRESREVFAPYE